MTIKQNVDAERATIDANLATLQRRRAELEQYETERRIRQDAAELAYLESARERFYEEHMDVTEDDAQARLFDAVRAIATTPSAEAGGEVVAAFCAMVLARSNAAAAYQIEAFLARRRGVRNAATVPSLFGSDFTATLSDMLDAVVKQVNAEHGARLQREIHAVREKTA